MEVTTNLINLTQYQLKAVYKLTIHQITITNPERMVTPVNMINPLMVIGTLRWNSQRDPYLKITEMLLKEQLTRTIVTVIIIIIVMAIKELKVCVLWRSKNMTINLKREIHPSNVEVVACPHET